MKSILILLILLTLFSNLLKAEDTISIQNIGHGTVKFEYKGMVIYVDPYSKVANFKSFPPADLIFITHEHRDHWDLEAIYALKKKSTLLIYTDKIKSTGSYTDSAIVMHNGDSSVFKGIPVKAVPGYNIVNKRPTGEPYHVKGVGNGYVFTFGSKRIYVAGDTENIPEMANLSNIYVAFLPMNLPYTMTPEMAKDAATKIHPQKVHLYHCDGSDTARFRSLMAGTGIQVKISNAVYLLPPRTKYNTNASKTENSMLRAYYIKE
jgi:L-ascorbate metabolism protein UlaG (beta-lactamase superfamily)